MNGAVHESGECRVIGEERLPQASGGADALCTAITQARGSGFKQVIVEVRILSPHLMAATQRLADGTLLPEVRMARSDQPLGSRSFQMLADALAAQLKAPRP